MKGDLRHNLSSAEDALESISTAVEKAGYKLGEQIFLALDAAASEFYDSKNNVYIFKKSDGSKKTADELIEYYAELCERFPIISIEDGCAENDWAGWKKLTAKLGKKIQLVGDDLFVTNVEFLRKGIAEHVANSILIKVNQIGTLTETLDDDRFGKETSLHNRDQSSLRRNGRYHDCRHRGGDKRWSNQDRFAFPQRSNRQIQSALAN